MCLMKNVTFFTTNFMNFNNPASLTKAKFILVHFSMYSVL